MTDEPKTEVVQETMVETPAPEPKVETKPVVSDDRTSEQFKKLTESNKRLLDANRILQENLARQKSTQQVPTIQNVDPGMEDFVKVDPVSGEQYVETDKLKKAMEETNARATRAEVAVQNLVKEQQRLEQTRQAVEQQKQEKEAFEAVPAVNPSSERFDRELSKRTEALLLHSYMHPEDYGGYALTFKQAAEAAQGQTVSQAKATEKAVETVKEEVASAKEEATADVRGSSSTNVSQPGEQEELDRLVNTSRYGRGTDQVWAIAQRLSKISHTGTPSSKE